MDRQFEFDVAFSFLAEDEAIALNLHNYLKDRVGCFIYSEEQKRLAGTDGEARFNQVFYELARVVVILYRHHWGQTPWTRVEETAIRNRAHDEGYEFALLIPMEPHIGTPKWFPKNRLWIGLERWGLEAAASVIEARVTEQDGEIHTLTPEDKLRIKLEEAQEERRRQEYLRINGRRVAVEEYDNLLSTFKAWVETIKSDPDWRIGIRETVKSDLKGLWISTTNRQITISPSLNPETILNIELVIWRGVWALPGTFMRFDPSRVHVWNYRFDADKRQRPVWVPLQTSNHNAIGTKEMVQEVLLMFIDIAEKARDEGSALG